MAHALIALGSNLGDRAQALQAAVDALASAPAVHVLERSAWIETAPVGGPADQPPFLNGAVLLQTSLPPQALHALLVDIEQRAGRECTGRWGPRKLDLDLLLYDECVLQAADLLLPHPRLAVRRFVLAPAAQVAPHMRHPQIGWTISQLLHHLEHAVPYFAIAATSAQLAEWLAEFVCQAGNCWLIADPLVGLRLEPGFPGTGGLAQAPPLEHARIRAMAIDRRTWPDLQQAAVSAFWIEQHLAAALEAACEQPERIQTEWQAVAEHVMPPKLLVVYVAPEAALGSAAKPPGWTILAELARRPGRGPLLWLEGLPPETAAEELLAAIEGMQSTLPNIG